MRILLTNDDGIHAPGLLALRRALVALGEVTVVAPGTVQSGAGHGITVDGPIAVRRVHVEDGCTGYSVRGRPADCVKLACARLLGEPPDLVLSGINDGANAGIHVLYSGTVAAASEAAMLGLPAVAVSLQRGQHPDFDQAARIAVKIVLGLLESGLTHGQLVSINIPDLTGGPPRGVRVVPQARRMLPDAYSHHKAPDGANYYWLNGTEFDRAADPADNDLDAMHEGYVAVTPLHFDRTDHELLAVMRRSADRLVIDL